ncbi:MAG TPA: hypothetical protein DCZ72_14085 [Armatimonadetes bacterium]|nr:hypothetical protein [Armatimonadota bacterium]
MVNQAGAMLTPFFTDQPVVDYASAKATDTARYGRFFWALLERGVYPPPSAFEAWFPSLAHDDAALTATLDAVAEALAVAGAAE